MKRTCTRVLRSALSLVLVFCLILSLCSAAFATEVADGSAVEAPADTINYVSLGDSMTNGYGLSGYNGNAGVEDYGDESYANWFADFLGAEHAQLAMSAMRAEDLHWLLEVDYDDSKVISVIQTLANDKEYYRENIDEFETLWYSVFTNGDYWTWKELVNNYRFDVAAYCIEGKDKSDSGAFNAVPDGYKVAYDEYTDVQALRIVAEYYQKSVKDADVVSLGIGNGNFGVFMFGRITEAINFTGDPEDAMIYDIENAIRECDPEIQDQLRILKAELENVLADYGIVANDGDDATVSTMEALYNSFMYAYISYALNYAGSMEAILQLNPDAEVIQVALMNTMKSNAAVTEEVTLGELMDYLFDPLNIYLAALPTVMQAVNNGVYEDATIYYAEADYVECFVDTYTKDSLKNSELIRSRFVGSIVDDMIWPLLGDLVVHITLNDIKAYEDQGAAYALTEPKKAASIAIYLAFEDAVIACKENAVTINSILGLGNVDFNAVMAEYAENAKNPTDEQKATAATVVAQGSEGALTYDDVVALVNGGDEAVSVAAVAMVKATVERDYADQLQQMNITADVFMTMGAANQLGDTYQPIYDKGIEDAKNALNTAVSSYEALCTLLATPDALSKALQNPENGMAGLLALFGRCVIGNGVSSHPSAGGHDALYGAVKTSYEEGYTAQDQTIKNAIEAAEVVGALVAEYYDEAYAYAYDYAESEGYIDAAAAALDGVYGYLNDLRVEAEMSPAFEAKLDATIGNAKLTVLELKELLLEADELDGATYNKAMELVAALETNLSDILALLEIAGADLSEAAYNELVALAKAAWSQYEAVKAYVETNLPIVMGIAADYLMEKVGEAYDAMVEAITAAAEKYGPAAVEWLKGYLTDAAVEVLNLLAAYGDKAVEFMVDNLDKVLEILGYVVETYGPEIADAVMEKAGEILDTMVEMLKEYGDEAWTMIQPIIEALGNKIEELPGELSAAAQEAINALLAAAKEYAPELADAIYDYLYNNPEEVIAFFQTYGPGAIEFLAQYDKEIVAVLGWLLVNYGDDVVDYVLNNPEALEQLVAWYEIHGENAWALIMVYLEELGIIDAAEDFIEDVKADPAILVNALRDLVDLLEKYGPEFAQKAYDYAEANGYIAAIGEALEALKGQIEDYIETEVLPALEAQAEALKAQLKALYEELESYKNALEGDLIAKLEALKAELEAKYAELENASEELKAEIEAAIAEIEAAIEAIEAAIAEVQAIIAEIEAAIAEAEAALEAICAKIAEIKALVERLVDEIIIAQEAIEALLAEGCENLDEAVAAVKAVIETVVELADALNIALDEVAGMIAAVAETVEAIAARIEAMLGDYVACITAIAKELSAGLEAAAAVLAAIADGIGNIPEDVQAAIDELNAELAAAVAEIEAAIAELNAQLAELNAQLAAKVAELEAAISVELAAKKAELEAKIAALEAELAAKKAELENAAEELKAEIEAQIAEIEAQIAEAKAALEAVIAEIEAIVAEIEAAIAEIEAKIAEVEDQIKALKAEIEAKIAETEAAIEALLEEAGALIDEAIAAAAAALKEALEEIQAEAEALLAEVIEEVTAAAEALAQEVIAQATVALVELAKEVKAAVDAMVNEFAAAIEEAYANATTGEYNIAETNYYVSLGDQSATSVSFADKLAAALNLGDDQWVNLAEESLSAADVVELIKAGDMTYISELAKADLVTVSFNPTTFATEQIEAILTQKDTEEIDWSKYVTEEGVPYVEEVIAELEAYLIEQGVPTDMMELNLVDIASTVAEAYAYSVVEFLANYIVMVEAIHEISPEAEVIIVGAYNSFDGMVITIDGTEVELPMGGLMQDLVDLTNAHYLAYAMLADNTTFVEVPETETVLDLEAYEIGDISNFFAMLDLLDMLRNIGDSVIPSDDGHEYIKDCILGVETIIEPEEPVGLKGDVNEDGVVDLRDVRRLLQYVNGNDVEINEYNSMVNGDDVIDLRDVRRLLQYVNGNDVVLE